MTTAAAELLALDGREWVRYRVLYPDVEAPEPVGWP